MLGNMLCVCQVLLLWQSRAVERFGISALQPFICDGLHCQAGRRTVGHRHSPRLPPFAHNFSWLGPLLLKDHVLCARKVFALRMVCKHDALPECEHRFLLTWLLRRAPGYQVADSLGIHNLYQEYKGSLFQAQLLRSFSDVCLPQ